MTDAVSRILELVMLKQSENPEFASDLVNYLKVIAIQECPDGRISEMKILIENEGTLNNFFEFVASFVPDLSERIMSYIDNY